jgi:hypothetical protein
MSTLGIGAKNLGGRRSNPGQPLAVDRGLRVCFIEWHHQRLFARLYLALSFVGVMSTEISGERGEVTDMRRWRR